VGGGAVVGRRSGGLTRGRRRPPRPRPGPPPPKRIVPGWRDTTNPIVHAVWSTRPTSRMYPTNRPRMGTKLLYRAYAIPRLTHSSSTMAAIAG